MPIPVAQLLQSNANDDSPLRIPRAVILVDKSPVTGVGKQFESELGGVGDQDLKVLVLLLLTGLIRRNEVLQEYIESISQNSALVLHCRLWRLEGCSFTRIGMEEQDREGAPTGQSKSHGIKVLPILFDRPNAPEECSHWLWKHRDGAPRPAIYAAEKDMGNDMLKGHPARIRVQTPASNNIGSEA